VLVLATKYFEGALDARPVSAILGPNRSEAAMSLLRSPAIALVCLSLLMTHQASAKTVSFIYFTVEVPNDWSLDPARANNILSGDRSILMVAANAVKIGPPTEQRGQNNDDSLPLDLVEKYKKLDPLGQKIEPIDDYSTRKINDRRLLVHRAYRMNPSTIVVLYYVVAPNYIVTITVTSKRSIDAMHAVMEPIIASLNWLDDAQAQEQDDLAPLRAEISRLLGQANPRKPSRSRSDTLSRRTRSTASSTRSSRSPSPGWRASTGPRAASSRPNRLSSVPSPSSRRRWGPSTPRWARRSTTWPSCARTRAASPRPSRSTGAASLSARRRWAPTTPMWAHRSTASPCCT
jgi:hypothetical protein